MADDNPFGPPTTSTSEPDNVNPLSSNNNTEAGSGIGEIFRKANHPVAAVFHVVFKIAALVIYMLNTWFTGNFIFVFVILILLLAFDFWTVKNVTGRLLVGLRWWNKIQDDGTNHWVFESISDRTQLGKMDQRIFWWGMYGSMGIWCVFALTAALTFSVSWLLVVSVAISLGSANIYGYTKCDKDAKQKMQNVLSSGAAAAMNSSIGQSIGSSIFSSAFGGGGNNNGNSSV
jgi:hypothetical protein